MPFNRGPPRPYHRKRLSLAEWHEGNRIASLETFLFNQKTRIEANRQRALSIKQARRDKAKFLQLMHSIDNGYYTHIRYMNENNRTQAKGMPKGVYGGYSRITRKTRYWRSGIDFVK